MRSKRLRRGFVIGLGTAAGIGLVEVVAGGRFGPGTLLGICLGAALGATLAVVDGPLEKRRTMTAACLLSAVLVATALWLHV